MNDTCPNCGALLIEAPFGKYCLFHGVIEEETKEEEDKYNQYTQKYK